MSRTKITFKKCFSVLFDIIVEIFAGLGPVVFVPLIGGFHVKSLVCSSFLHIIYFLDSLNFWIVVD